MFSFLSLFPSRPHSTTCDLIQHLSFYLFTTVRCRALTRGEWDEVFFEQKHKNEARREGALPPMFVGLWMSAEYSEFSLCINYYRDEFVFVIESTCKRQVFSTQQCCSFSLLLIKSQPSTFTVFTVTFPNYGNAMTKRWACGDFSLLWAWYYYSPHIPVCLSLTSSVTHFTLNQKQSKKASPPPTSSASVPSRSCRPFIAEAFWSLNERGHLWVGRLSCLMPQSPRSSRGPIISISVRRHISWTSSWY